MGLLNKFRNVPIGDLKQEVAESIYHLLNTKQTFGAWQKDFGLDDYSYANKGDVIIQKMMEDIFSNIKKEERRFKIEKIRVLNAGKISEVCFELEGTLNGKKQIFLINLHKNIHSVEVKG